MHYIYVAYYSVIAHLTETHHKVGTQKSFRLTLFNSSIKVFQYDVRTIEQKVLTMLINRVNIRKTTGTGHHV